MKFTTPFKYLWLVFTLILFTCTFVGCGGILLLLSPFPKLYVYSLVAMYEEYTPIIKSIKKEYNIKPKVKRK